MLLININKMAVTMFGGDLVLVDYMEVLAFPIVAKRVEHILAPRV